MAAVPGDRRNGEFRLGEWLVRPSLNQLSRGGEPVRLRPKVMDVLVLLAEHAGEVVAKETIVDAVWAKKFLADSALTRAVFELREALGDEAHGSRYIETIPKRGYRLVAQVTDVPAATPAREPPPASAARPSRRPLALAAVGVSLLALLLWAVMRARPDRSTQAAATPVRIVVLPFENLGRAEDDDLAAGLTDEITGRLASVPGLAVISPTTAFRYAGTSKATAQIGRELGVSHMLCGTVRWNRSAGAQGQLRITPRLVRVSDDVQVWSEVYTSGVEGVLRVQSEIAIAVAREVGAAIGRGGRPRRDIPFTGSLDAYQAYLRGRSHAEAAVIGERDNRVALSMFERAVALDPSFALAHAEIARARSHLYHFGFERTEANRAAAAAAIARALELDPTSGTARLILGLHRYWCFRDYEGALQQLRLAQAGLGRTAETLEIESWVLRRMGRWEESLRLGSQALALDALNWRVEFNLGETCMYMRLYREAHQLFGRAIAHAPDQEYVYGYLSQNWLAWTGTTDEARRVLETMVQPGEPWPLRNWIILESLDGRYARALDRLAASQVAVVEGAMSWEPRAALEARIYRLLGREAQARQALEATRELATRALRERPDDFRVWSTLGVTLAGLGLKDEALRAATRAVEIMPLERDAVSGQGPLADMAEVDTIVGEYDKACQILDRLLSVPSMLSTPLVRLDPIWEPLRQSPCFQALLRRHGATATPATDLDLVTPIPEEPGGRSL